MADSQRKSLFPRLFAFSKPIHVSRPFSLIQAPSPATSLRRCDHTETHVAAKNRPAMRMRSEKTPETTTAIHRGMQFNKLGSSDILVSQVCLGTMTWGVQNTEGEAHAQLDYAIKERGVNFIDTAEMYPVPSSAPGWASGRTERYIGTWLAANPGIRENIVLATKVSGYMQASDTVSNRYDPPRDGKLPARLDKGNIHAACEASLRRLQTSYIDLYQIHWPDRYVPLWVGRVYDPTRERSDATPIEESAAAIKELLESGKIRSYGLSNETPLGLCEWIRAADELKMPRPVTIQNHFSLIERTFEGHLAEICAPSNYNIGLLPWSILAGGALSGKYLGKIDANGQISDPKLQKARHTMFSLFQSRFLSPAAVAATEQYNLISKEAGFSLATLAHAFCKSRWYIPSTIIGATTMDQLEENINAFEVDLSMDILQKIDDIHESRLDPCVTLAFRLG